MVETAAATKDDAAGAAGIRLAVKFQQQMMTAVKEQRWQDALTAARQANSLDPSHPLVIEFMKVLEEKIDLDEASSSSDEDDDEDEVAGSSAVDAIGKKLQEADLEGSDDSDESSSDEDSEDDDEDAAGDYTDLVEEVPEIEAIRVQHAQLKMSHAERNAMRSRLRADIAALKEKEAMAKLATDDPLLGA